MKRLFGLIFLLGMTLICPAAEIVAWKVPLVYYAGSGLKTSGIARRKTAPESSPFFKPGDQLWDLKQVMPVGESDPKLSLDWLVWNATSEQLVAKGDWADLSAIHGLLQLDQRAAQCRVTLNVFQVPADKAPPKADSKPLQSISLSVKSGQRCKAEWVGYETAMKLDAEATVANPERIADLRVTCSALVPDQLRMEVNTMVSLKSGEAKWIARDFDGQRGLDIELAASLETMEGILLEDQVMIQRAGVPERLMAELNPPKRCKTGKGWLLIFSLPPFILNDIVKPADKQEVDPFSDTAPNESLRLSHMPSVKTPEFLSEWLKNDVWDMKKPLGNFIPEIKNAGNFAGYDPIRECLYVHSTDEDSLDKVDALFATVCYCGPTTVIANLDGIGETRLVGKSGQKTSLSRLAGEEVIKRLLEIEPTITENEDVLDMRLHFEDETRPNQQTHLDVATTLPAGKAKELYSGSKGDSKTRLSLKAGTERMSWD